MRRSIMSSIPNFFKLRVNIHGVIALGAIAAMVAVAFYLRWNIIWWYFVLAILIYSIAVISLTEAMEESGNLSRYRNYPGAFQSFRWLLSCHFALLLLAGGLWLNFTN